MTEVKICPNCGLENQADSFFCRNAKCEEDLTRTPLFDPSNPVETLFQEAVLPPEISISELEGQDTDFISFVTETGQEFKGRSGDLIGRGYIGGWAFASFTKVSRKHFLLEKHEGQWYVTDCSLNGTWVNGRRLTHERHQIDFGDQLLLSRDCRLEVI